MLTFERAQIAGTSDTSFTHNLLSEQGVITGAADEEDIIKKNAATLFGGESVWVSLERFIHSHVSWCRYHGLLFHVLHPWDDTSSRVPKEGAG